MPERYHALKPRVYSAGARLPHFERRKCMARKALDDDVKQ